MDAMDAIDGLKALEQVVETIGEELHDLYQRRGIPQIERVTLQTLEWTLAKLADDLHTMDTEVRDLRMAEASARRGASEAQQKQRDEQLQSLSVFNELRWQLSQVTAERDELRAQLAKVRAQEAELSGNPGELPAKTEPPEWHRWKHGTKLFHPRHPDIVRCVHDATAEDMERWYRGGWRELVEPEPASESYQWQVGDEVINRGDLRAVDVASEGWIKLDGLFSCCRQTTWERAGWKLYRKASDLGVQQLTPRQVEISDSGTDGEGQP